MAGAQSSLTNRAVPPGNSATFPRAATSCWTAICTCRLHNVGHCVDALVVEPVTHDADGDISLILMVSGQDVDLHAGAFGDEAVLRRHLCRHDGTCAGLCRKAARHIGDDADPDGMSDRVARLGVSRARAEQEQSCQQRAHGFLRFLFDDGKARSYCAAIRLAGSAPTRLFSSPATARARLKSNFIVLSSGKGDPGTFNFGSTMSEFDTPKTVSVSM